MKLKISMLKLVKLILIEEDHVDHIISANNLVKPPNVVMIKNHHTEDVIELNK
jgi:hypothetical protein